MEIINPYFAFMAMAATLGYLARAGEEKHKAFFYLALVGYMAIAWVGEGIVT